MGALRDLETLWETDELPTGEKPARKGEKRVENQPSKGKRADERAGEHDDDAGDGQDDDDDERELAELTITDDGSGSGAADGSGAEPAAQPAGAGPAEAAARPPTEG